MGTFSPVFAAVLLGPDTYLVTENEWEVPTLDNRCHEPVSAVSALSDITKGNSTEQNQLRYFPVAVDSPVTVVELIDDV